VWFSALKSAIKLSEGCGENLVQELSAHDTCLSSKVEADSLALKLHVSFLFHKLPSIDWPELIHAEPRP
jgi:hypothetical protein